MATEPQLDQAKADEFAGTVIGFLNGAFTALGLSVGHRSGLLDAMADLEPSTSSQIADAAGLEERYVREWLAGMFVAGIVDYDRTAKTYSLPAEHALVITSAAGPRNLGQRATFLPLMGNVEDELLHAFRNGGGVPYSSFEAFHAIMAEDSGARFDHSLIDVQIPLVPEIEGRLETGIDVADLGCGSGHAINLMAREWPNSRFVGYDFSEESIGAGRAEAADMGLENATFVEQDVANMQGSARFDLITTFDAVHDQADPAGMLHGIASLLREDGSYLCVDMAASSDVANNVELPLGPMQYMISMFHCMPVSLALGGAGLGAMWGQERALEMLKEAGFTDIDVAQVDGDPINNYYVASTR